LYTAHFFSTVFGSIDYKKGTMKNTITSMLLLAALTIQGQVVLEKEILTNLKLTLVSHLELSNGDFLFVGSASPANQDSVMALIVKTDSLLQVLWAKRYKIFHKDRFQTISRLGGSYIVGGTARENFNTASGGSLMEIDTAGTVLWHEVYSSSYDDNTISVRAGSANSMLAFIRKGVNNTPTKICHVDATGSLLLTRIFSTGNTNLVAEAVTGDPIGNYYMTGYYFNPVLQENVFYVLSITETGVNWFKEYHIGRSATVSDITLTTTGLAVAGSCIDISFPTTTNSFVVSLDLLGNVLWAHEVGQNLAYNESASGIDAGGNGDLLITGQSNTAQGFQAMLYSLDANGLANYGKAYGMTGYQYFSRADDHINGQKLLTGSNSNGAYLALTDPAGNTACTTWPLTLVTDTLTMTVTSPVLTTGSQNVTPASPAMAVTSISAVIENVLCQGWTGTGESLQQLVKLYPNPATNHVCIHHPEGVSASDQIEVSDITGRYIPVPTVRSETETFMDVSGLSGGMYVVYVRSGSGTVSFRFVCRP
jgi:hypothetical protein